LTLGEALDRYAGRTTLLVELKARDAPGGTHDLQLARVATELLQRGRWLDRTFVLCFDPLVLEACKQVDARVRTVLNLDPPPRLNAALRERLAALDMLSTNVRTLTPAFGRAVAGCGKPLLVYTCNATRQIELALAAGAHGVMSDRPAWLAAQLAARGLRS
jgi:glycerophosphoryl diester phosphodiesterase